MHHHWQDITISVSLLAFNIALIPSILGKHKPRFATSLMTALFVIPELVAFFSLALWYSFAMAFVNAVFWATLAVQRYAQTRPKKKH